MKKNITIIGFMGSGKSTIGQQIAIKKGMEFIDLDIYIQNSVQQSIPEIFDTRGEDGFREIEANCLRKILAKNNQLIAPGGGTPCFFNNMEVIGERSLSIYLKVSPQTLTERLIRSPNPRPLIKGKSKEELMIYIESELAKREKFYLQADHFIESDKITAEDLLRLLLI